MSELVIRYMAATDDSDEGGLALQYLVSLLKLAPVRLVSVSGALSSRWERATSLLVTPMSTRFVNVVCCAPTRWAWRQRVSAPRADGSTEYIDGEFELRTKDVRNVLITASKPPPEEMIWTGSARKYDVMIVPTPEIRDAWDPVPLPGGRRPYVIHPKGPDIETLGVLILSESPKVE